METICMKCQILFPEKNKKKYFKMMSAENFNQSAKHKIPPIPQLHYVK